MAIKKQYLTKKIEGTIFDIFPRTSADQVNYNATTVADELATIVSNISDITEASTGIIDTRIARACQDLYNEILGITDQDSTPVMEAYDTLKEIAAWLDAHGDITAGILNDISALQTVVGDANSGLVKNVADLQTTVGDSSAGLVKDVSGLKTTVGNVNSGLVKGVADLQSAVGDANSGLVKDVSGLKTSVGDANTGMIKDLADLTTDVRAIPIVEVSETNGNISINNTETNVYTHPETHDASMITYGDDGKTFGESMDELMTEMRDLRLDLSLDSVFIRDGITEIDDGDGDKLVSVASLVANAEPEEG